MHRAGGQDAVIRGAGGTPVTGDLIADSVDAWPSGWPVTTPSSSAPARTAPAPTRRPRSTVADWRRPRRRRAAGVRRFVLVSVFMDALRDRPRSEGFEHYMAVKRAADVTWPAPTSTG